MLQIISNFYGGSVTRVAPMALSATTPRARLAVEKSPGGFFTRYYALTLALRDPLVMPERRVYSAPWSDDDEADEAIVARDTADFKYGSTNLPDTEDTFDWHRCNVWVEQVLAAHVVAVHHGDASCGGDLPRSVLAASWWLCKCAPAVAVFLKLSHVSDLDGLLEAPFAAYVYVVHGFDCTEAGLVDLSPLRACPELRVVIAPDDVADLSWATACPHLEQVRLYCAVTRNVGTVLPHCTHLRHVHLLGDAGGDAEWLKDCTRLRFLSLDSVPLARDPHLLDQLSCLQELDVDANDGAIVTALANCTSLRYVSLNGCGRRNKGNLFESLPVLPNMQELFIQNLSQCCLPWLSACTSLTKLSIFNCSMRGCEGLAQLPHLRSLRVNYCSDFHLEWLTACHGLEKVDISGDESLRGFNGLRAHPRLRKVHASPIHLNECDWLSECTALESVNLSLAGTAADHTAPARVSTHHPQLRKVTLYDANATNGAADLIASLLGGAPNVRCVCLTTRGHWSSPAFGSSLATLKALKDLTLVGKCGLADLSAVPPSVVRLCVRENNKVVRLGSADDTVAPRPSLRCLELDKLTALATAHALASFSALTSLVITDCARLSEFPCFAALAHLAYLVVCETHVASLTPLATAPVLRHLELRSCTVHDGDYTPLGRLMWLESLDIVKSKITSVPRLSGCQRTLCRLTLDSCAELTDVSAIGILTELRELSLKSLGVTSLRGLETCAQLATLDIDGCRHLVDLSPLGALTRLFELKLFDLGALTRLDGLSGCSGLVGLRVRRCDQLEDASALAALHGLCVLHLSGASITDVRALEHCVSLRKLNLYGCDALEDASCIGKLTRLNTLNLSGTCIDDVSWIQSLSCLRSLSIVRCRLLRDLSPLAHLPSLTDVSAQNCGVSDMDWVYDATAPLANVNIAGCLEQLVLHRKTLPTFVKLKEDY